MCLSAYNQDRPAQPPKMQQFSEKESFTGESEYTWQPDDSANPRNRDMDKTNQGKTVPCSADIFATATFFSVVPLNTKATTHNRRHCQDLQWLLGCEVSHITSNSIEC